MPIARVDCRTVAAFCQGHHAHACSIPVDELPARMHELPKTSEPLIVYAGGEDLQKACEFLSSKGYQVAQAIEWTPLLAANLQAISQLEVGTQSQRLWQPAPLMARFVTEFMPAHQIQPGQSLDIGCGAGRDMVYLAMHGWQMTGIDYIPGALQRAQYLAHSQHVTVTTLQLDLETGEDPFVTFADGQFALITVARYLHRPLFPWLKRLLKPGGILIYQTFMQGSEQFGSPRNPNFLLKPGELAQVFAHTEILLDEVETLDDGRPVSAFICRQAADCL
ncbi:MAG: methyltransferase type 11 [Thiothrix lacustris]|uniref:Methyltransferase type 11 n=1 Tax=Thiothrix lacustris TaxID=525917 RepID=A0A1Y1QKK0_9GAMM|nr:MAG: methyltransferase type 11 [Thiothrix lacustris]